MSFTSTTREWDLFKAWRKGDPRIEASKTGLAAARRGRAMKRARTVSPYQGLAAGELKFLDGAKASTSLTTSWAMYDIATMNAIGVPSVGTLESERLGRSYKIHSLHITLELSIPAFEGNTTPFADAFARILIVKDKQTNNAQMSASTSPVINVSTSPVLYGYRNLEEVRRYDVLYDKIIHLKPSMVNEGAVNAFANAAVFSIHHINLKFKKPLEVQCSATTALVTSVNDNSLHMQAIANDTVVDMKYLYRIRFTG